MLTVETATQEKLPLRFAVPREFVELDLAEQPETRAERLIEAMARTLPDTTIEQRVHFVLATEYMVQLMRQSGVVYAATLLARAEDEPPRLTTAQFTVVVKEARLTGMNPLATLAEQLHDPGARRVLDLLDLPAGQALAIVEERGLTLPSNMFGIPGEHTHLIRQLQLLLPFPARDRIAVFALSTECLDDWDQYVDIMGAIAKTIEFKAPSSLGITEALAGGSW